MNKDSKVITISYKKLSMTEDELYKAMHEEIEQISQCASDKIEHIIADYKPYIKSARERGKHLEQRGLLQDLIDQMDADELKFVLKANGILL